MTIAQGGGSSSKDLIRSVSGHANNLMSEVAKVIIGKPENIRKVAIGILANGNILIEDNPGLAKTLMSNTFAEALGCKFKRVQFTPDLLPADITQVTCSFRSTCYPEPNRAGRDIPASRGSNGQIPHENEHGIPINGRGEGNPTEEEASWKG